MINLYGCANLLDREYRGRARNLLPAGNKPVFLEDVDRFGLANTLNVSYNVRTGD